MSQQPSSYSVFCDSDEGSLYQINLHHMRLFLEANPQEESSVL